MNEEKWKELEYIYRRMLAIYGDLRAMQVALDAGGASKKATILREIRENLEGDLSKLESVLYAL